VTRWSSFWIEDCWTTGRRRTGHVVAAAVVLVLSIAVGNGAAAAPENPIDILVRRLEQASLTLTRADGSQIALRRRGSEEPEPLHEAAIVELLTGAQLSKQQANSLWPLLADTGNKGLVTLPIVRALASASSTPAVREIMWTQLAGIAKAKPGGRSNPHTLLALFERHRDALLPALGDGRDTEAAGNAMVDLMTSSSLFGDDVEDGVRWIGARYPEALARRMQREREQGRPVKWEAAGFEQMMLWKDRHLKPGARDAPRTLEKLDAAGETFAVLFNSLYVLDDEYRQKMLRNIGPVEAFDIVIGGEAELYRMGTSSFRKFLHPLVVRGIEQSGSFEAFVATTAFARLSAGAAGVFGRRGMVYLRVASAFGLFEPVLATVRDHALFIGNALESLGDPATFESNAAVLLDLVTEHSSDPAVEAFRRQLLDRLYERYGMETGGSAKNIYGSLLSVYQSVTGDRRDPAIDHAFPLDSAVQRAPFDKLFSPLPNGGHVHRILMRFDGDIDGSSNYESFRTLMTARRAQLHSAPAFEVYRLVKERKSIEIYVNRPSPAGVREGIEELRKILDGADIHTVIGRGHSGIIAPLLKDATRVLGSRTTRVMTVMVGTCGGTSSVRELIDTFGYTQFLSTRSTGRQLLNEAVIAEYITALLDLAENEELTLNDVLARALDPYRRAGNSDGIREDAGFYHVNSVSVFAAMLFDRHVRRTAEAIVPLGSTETDARQPARLTWQRLTPKRRVASPVPDRKRRAAPAPVAGVSQSATTTSNPFIND
jgi:hypothetical protein